jgi:rod shape-determining protein MreB
MIIGVPSGITQVEKRAVEESAKQAGAREVYTIMEPMAAAIGAGLMVQEPSGNMVVDIGGGTTEVAVISLKSVVFCRSIRVGGDEMDRAIVQYVKRKYNLLIGERTAERIKIDIGAALLDSSANQQSVEVKGRDLVTGVPKTIILTAPEVNEALLETIASIVDVVRVALENTPPELSSDLVDKGIVMAGGSSLLRGLSQLISKETGLPVRVAEDPLFCVVKGAGKVLEELNFFQDALFK